MEIFKMNGIVWGIRKVRPDNPVLIDRTGRLTVACTDPITKRIYISDQLYGNEYSKVLMHELCHCTIISYGLLDYIHKAVKPEYWIDAEEFVCNIIADYGLEMQKIAERLSSLIH